MFCPNCGAKVEDGSVFCEACGAKIEEEVSVVTENSGQEADPAAKFDIKKKLPVIAIAVAAVVAVVGIGSVVLGGKAYEKPVKEVVSLFNKETTDLGKYLDAAFPKYVGNAYDSAISSFKDVDEVEDALEEIDDSFEEIFETIKDEYGKNAKLTYEITDADEMSKKDLNAIEDGLDEIRSELKDLVDEDSYTYEAIEDILDSKQMKKFETLVEGLIDDLKDTKVTEGYTLEIEFELKGSEDDADLELTFDVIKLNGKWCIEPEGLVNAIQSAMWSF